MKSLLIAVLIGLSSSLSAQQTTLKQDSSFSMALKQRALRSIGKPFPSFTATWQNENFTNKNLDGKIVFINFWFASCAPCIAEMDALNELYDSLKHNNRFEFISFTYEKQAKIDEVAKEHRMQYKIVSISFEDCYRLNQNNGFPASIILDDKGIITYLKLTASTNKEEARKAVFEEFFPKLKAMLQ
ncbi:TlpA family protein disulfide reductase [Ferruginibacter sp. SUN106]|uniref:TlpA family protein disulfide reductase n=1 Tax=Ferruginibacter sp. SUN106 TaxID=2978348 RepID=UPI003D3619DB